MKTISITILTILIGASSFAQSTEREEVTAEGEKIYTVEMASWFGTDLFISKFADARAKAGGYFSYIQDNKAICVFVSKGDNPMAIGTFTFDSTYDVHTALVDVDQRQLTAYERDIFLLRQAAVRDISSDTLFHAYEGMNLNIIPLNDEKGKRVYVLTGPEKQGLVVFGNDYLLTFDNEHNLTSKKRLHKNIICVEYAKEGAEGGAITMHTHSPETGDLITATDICTLRLYEKLADWKQHYVWSQNMVSIWDCTKDYLTVMTREAWDKISGQRDLQEKQ